MPQLISDQYRALNAELHENPTFGVGGEKTAHNIARTIRKQGYTTVLDYGAGKGVLSKTLTALLPDITIHAYDPAIPEISKIPLDRYDIVVCTDVMEHIEPDCLDAVLDHLKDLTDDRLLVSVATEPAKKALPDGRNAHLIVQPAKWWAERFNDRFSIKRAEAKPNHAEFVLLARNSE